MVSNNQEVVFHKETESKNNELGTNQLPNLTDSNSGGETLQDKDLNRDSYPTIELKVYTRKKLQYNKEHPHPIPSQLPSLSPGAEQAVTQSGITSVPIYSFISECVNREFTFDFDIPIAIRKWVRTCTKRPIAKYLSYHNLSNKHKAFTSNISHLVIPINIQEALEHPS
ncbi:hypothetical protein ACOSQ3_012885 [Xanthoceras sorbifolium]